MMSGRRKKIIGLFVITVVLFGVGFSFNKYVNAAPSNLNPDFDYIIQTDGTYRILGQHANTERQRIWTQAEYDAEHPGQENSSAFVTGSTVGKPAGTDTRLGVVMGFIFYYLAAALGAVIDLVITLMLLVGQFNNILGVGAVQSGWIIVRDLCNNFFIIILLVIAVGTILRVPVYSEWKKLLPKLLIMAILINFSKLFAGLMIDFSQIVMLTFAYKIATMPSGGKGIVLGALGFPNFFDLNTGTDAQLRTALNAQVSALNILDVISALLIALVVGVVTVVVMVVITVILIYRIIMFWFLVILSPLAFLASTLPRVQGYSKRWWDEMFKYLMVGPVMMFFLYISLQTMMTIGNSGNSTLFGDQQVVGLVTTGGTTKSAGVVTPASTAGQSRPLNTMSGAAGLFNAIIVIGLLVGTLMVAQEFGVAGASVASGALSRLKKAGKGAAFGGAKLAGRAAWGTAKGAGRMALGGAKAIDAGLLGGKVGKTVGGIKNRKGMLGGAAAGAALGSVVPGLGTAVGAIGGGLLGAISGRIFDKRKGKRAEIAANIKASAEGDKGKYLDENDKKLEVDDEGNLKNPTDLAKVKKQWNNDKGFYEEKEFDAALGALKDAEYIYNTRGVYKNAAGINTFYKNGDLLDENGAITTENSKAKYKHNGSDFKEVAYDGATDTVEYKSVKNQQEGVRDIDHNVVHRWGEYKDEKGDLYRKMSEDDDRFRKVNGRGEFVSKRDEKNTAIDKDDTITARGAYFGGDVKMKGDKGAAGWSAYLGATNKGAAARDAADDEKISQAQKAYVGLSDEVLGKMLETEGDSTKKKAIVMAIKDGFKSVKLVNIAKDALAGNGLLVKKFNDEMNKRKMVLNNTRADGTLDTGNVAKLVSSGKAKWSDQDPKTMTTDALKAMSTQLGPTFHKELESMSKTHKDREVITKALGNDLDSRGFVGDDLAIRKSFGAFSGEFTKAFSKKGVLNNAELEKSLSKISKAEVYEKIGEPDLNNSVFQEAMANSMSMSMMQKLVKSNDISPERFQKFVDIIKVKSATNAKANALLGKMTSNPAFHDYI